MNVKRFILFILTLVGGSASAMHFLGPKPNLELYFTGNRNFSDDYTTIVIVVGGKNGKFAFQNTLVPREPTEKFFSQPDRFPDCPDWLKSEMPTGKPRGLNDKDVNAVFKLLKMSKMSRATR